MFTIEFSKYLYYNNLEKERVKYMLKADLKRKLIHHTCIIMFVLSGIITLGLLWLLSMMGTSTGMDYMDGVIKNILTVAFLLLLCLDGITFSLALILNTIYEAENGQGVDSKKETLGHSQNQVSNGNNDQQLII